MRMGLPFIGASTVFKRMASKDATDPSEKMKRFSNLRSTDLQWARNVSRCLDAVTYGGYNSRHTQASSPYRHLAQGRQGSIFRTGRAEPGPLNLGH